MRPAVARLVPALLVALAATLAACGGSDGDPGTGPAPTPDLRLSDTTATGMTMLVVHVRGGGAATGTVSALVDTAATPVSVIDDSTVAVPVPALPAGRYQLTLRVGSRALAAPVRVTAAPTVADPAAYVGAVLTGLEQALDRQAALFADTATRPAGVDSAAWMQGIAATRTAVAGMRSEFAALSADDQRAVALALRANAGALGIDAMLAGPAGVASLATFQGLPAAGLLMAGEGACLGGQECVDVMFQFVEFARDVTIAYLGVTGMVEVGSWFAGPAGKVFAKVARVGLSAGWLYFQFSELTGHLNRPAAVEKVKDPLDVALGIDLRDAAVLANQEAGDRLVLRASVPRTITVRGEYRSIVAGDAATMSAVAKLRDALAGLRTYWNRVVAGVPGLSLAAPALAAAPRRRADDVILPQFLQVANVTLPGATASTSASGNALAITLKNDRQGDDHPLSFDLRYVAPGMAPRAVTVPARLYPKEYRVLQLEIHPETAAVRKGGTRQFERIPYDSSGDVIHDSLLVGRATVWASSRVAKATVSSTGMVTGVDTGTVIISATLDGRRAERSTRVGGSLNVAFHHAATDWYGTTTDLGGGWTRLSCTHRYVFEAYDPNGTTADPPAARVVGYRYRLTSNATGALLTQQSVDIPVEQQWNTDPAQASMFDMTWYWDSTNGTRFTSHVTLRYRDLRDGLVYDSPEAVTACPNG